MALQPNSSNNAGPSRPADGYTTPAPYDNKTDRPDSPSFLTMDGDPDPEAMEANKKAVDDDKPILPDEEIDRMMKLAEGSGAHLASSRIPDVSPRVAELHEKAYNTMKLYWKEGWSRSLRREFNTINVEIDMENEREGKPEDYDNHFPAEEIIKLFNIYQPLFLDMTRAPPNRRQELARKFLDGSRMFIKQLSQRGISFRRLVTPHIWTVLKTVLLRWATTEDMIEVLTNLSIPTYQQREILKSAEPLMESFFKNLQRKDQAEANGDLQALEAVNGQLRMVNAALKYREEDHALPLIDFYELLEADNDANNGVDESSLVLYAGRIKGKLELMGLEGKGIPSQFHPGPEFISEQKRFIDELLKYPMDLPGKEKAGTFDLPSIASSSRALPPPESTQTTLSKAPPPPSAEPQLTTDPAVLSQMDEDLRVRFASLSNPLPKVKGPSVSDRRGAPPPPPSRGSSDVTDIDASMDDEPSDNGDVSDDDEGTMMIHPGLKSGITPHGKVVFVRPLGRGAYRLFLNAGTERKPFLIVRNGSDFPRGFADEWFQNPNFRSESDKPKGWKPESFRSVDFIQTESPTAGAKRAAPAYIYGFENGKPALWTKSEFIMRCGKSSAMSEIQKRLTFRAERQRKLADARGRCEHPDTGMPLTSSDRQATPWLFSDGPAFDTSGHHSGGGSRFTKIISSGGDDDFNDRNLVPPKATDPAVKVEGSGSATQYPASGATVPLETQLAMLMKMVVDLQQQLDATRKF